MNKFGLKFKKTILTTLFLMIVSFSFIGFGADVLAAATDTFGLQEFGDTTELAAQDIRVTIARIINAALGLLGVLALGIILYGGFVYMTAGGQQDKIDKAKKILINGTIGLIIIMSSWAITKFVINQLEAATKPPTPPPVCDGDGIKDPKCPPDPKDPTWCIENLFLAKSITPSQEQTNMNNAVIRAVFTQEVGTPAEEVLKITTGSGEAEVDITTDFIFAFTDANDQRVLEAKYNIDANLCAEENKKPGINCLPVLPEEYHVEVQKNVVSKNGEAIELGDVCDGFQSVTKVDFEINQQVNDFVVPIMSAISIIVDGNPSTQPGVKLMAGGIYPIQVTVNDEKGVGYVHMNIAKENGTDSVTIYDGPSEGNSDQPFEFSYHLGLGLNIPALTKYIITVTAYDIDHNQSTQSSHFFVKPAFCEDPDLTPEQIKSCGSIDTCDDDNPCFKGLKCVEGQCIAFPEITGIEPQDGAPGNWVTIYGHNFGNTPGKILFASDNNNNSIYDDSEWLEASVVQCALGSASWHHSYAVVEVPNVANMSSAALFSGFDQSVSLTPSPVYKGEEAEAPFTVSFWAKMDSEDEEVQVLASGGVVEAGGGWSFHLKPGPILSMEVYDTVTHAYRRVYTTVPLGQYVHIAGVYSPDNYVALYVNGKEFFESNTNPGSLSQGGGNAVNIGKRNIPGLDSFYFKGSIDEFAMFDSVLSAEQIKSHFEAGSSEPGAYKNLILSHNPAGYWRFFDNKMLALAPAQDAFDVEVEGDVQFSQIGLFGIVSGLGESSAVKIVRSDDPELFDTSVDGYGIKPVPADDAGSKGYMSKDEYLAKYGQENGGLFTKNDIKRPGLCEVRTPNGAHAAQSDAFIIADGKTFGQTANTLEAPSNSFLNFAGLSAKINSWFDSFIEANVPVNLAAGTFPVSVVANGQFSNSVPFSILPGDLEESLPVITSIDPEENTPGSYSTVFGNHFGASTGIVFLSKNQGGDCLAPGDCYTLELAECKSPWSNTQIVIKTPDIDVQDYFMVVERGDNALQSNGLNKFAIIEGEIKPSICELDPESGPSPLPTDHDGLTLTGHSFSVDPIVYFWRSGADEENIDTWLSSEINPKPNGDPAISSKSDTLIKTHIPVDADLGIAMNSGPIKVKSSVTQELSNSVQYEVSDCRDSEEEFIGFQCCTDGAEAGMWKDDQFVCEGETREAGYVWRFSSGLIPNLPQVVEYCDAGAWGKDGVKTEFPSPVPSLLWDEGTNACLNATIAIRFSIGMDAASINSDTVQIYSCGVEDTPDCLYNAATAIPADNLSIDQFEDQSDTLLIRKGNNGFLAPNTWYRVLLKKDILSMSVDLGVGNSQKLNLEPTKKLPGNDSVAYYFDFKTGDASQFCTLKKAWVDPVEKTVGVLGHIMHPWNKTKPFYYHVYGQANQVCTILDVDGMGWDWSTDPVTKAEHTDAPDLSKGITDSRVTIEALEQAHPVPVEIKTKTSEKYAWFDFLKNASVESPFEIAANADILEIEGSKDNKNYSLKQPFTLEYSYVLLGEVANNPNWSMSSVQNVYGFIYTGIDASDGLCFEMYADQGPVSVCSGQAPVVGQQYHYVIVWDGQNLRMLDTNGELASVAFAGFAPDDGLDGNNLILGSHDPDEANPIHHVIDKFRVMYGQLLTEQEIQEMLGGVGVEIQAEPSELFINLLDPEVLTFEPNCTESCINANIVVTFNTIMASSTYKDGFTVYKCLDGAQCNNNQEQQDLYEDSEDGDDKTMKLTLKGGNLDKNTYYKVALDDNIKALERIDPPLEGKSLQPVEWVFKTKDDATPCTVNRLEINPDPFTTNLIGSQTKYIVTPFSTPNKCSSVGQALNKWDYEYTWDTEHHQVATITNFNTGFGWKSFCSPFCLPKGSVVPSDSDSDPYLCGNGVVEPGEDCDIALVADGTCKLNCTYSDDKKINLGMLGSGPVPPKTELQDLDQNAGPYCGDGIVEGPIEACDIGLTPEKATEQGKDLTESLIGCTSTCLHAGTYLESKWCEDPLNIDFVDSPECQKTISVCGNGAIEKTEECEVGIGGATAETCSTSCLWQDLCETGLEQCDPNDPLDLNQQGCNADCTLAGSSVLYSAPSLCGDGKLGIGEAPACENIPLVFPEGKAFASSSPVQLATAVGEGVTDPALKLQTTKVKVELYTNPLIKQEADYTLQCGFTEFATIQDGAYNDCPGNDNGDWGVASNSCCLARPQRLSGDVFHEYPRDGQGFGNETVCLNSLIEAPFDKKIEDLSLDGNIALVRGETDPTYLCSSVEGGYDVTEKINSMLGIITDPAVEFGFFEKIWNKVKNFFVKLFGGNVFATTVQNAQIQNIKKWCAGEIKLTISESTIESAVLDPANPEEKKDISAATAKINKLLEPDSVYAVFLEGGLDGIKSVDGVGIKSPDHDIRDDIWLFKTGDQNKICKIQDIVVLPDSQLYNKPNHQEVFFVTALNNSEQKITSIPGVYEWKWKWLPDNAVFDIPDIDNSSNIITSKELEGHINGIVTAEILDDTDPVGNQAVGTTFSKAIDLTANFCENPWPAFVGNSWSPWPDPTDQFNYSFSYCADAGNFGDKTDDLPFLQIPPIDLAGDIGHCEYNQNACLEDSQCENFAKLGTQVYEYGEYNSGCYLTLPGEGEEPHLAFSSEGFKNINIGGENLTIKQAYGCGADIECQDPHRYMNDSGEYKFFMTAVGAPNLTDEEMMAMINSATCQPMDNIEPQQCIGADPLVTANTLLKKVFFTDNNEDVIGIQVFENPDSKSLQEWYNEQNFDLAGMSPTTVAGYDALTNGSSYYIDFLNYTESGIQSKIESFIFLISINPDSEAETQNVFKQLVDSLQFNINLTEHGKCLDQNAASVRIAPDQISDIDCSTDFDCRGLDGAPKAGTNGECSVAKSKFFRDLDRVQNIGFAQKRLSQYFVDSAGLPLFKGGMKAGTFVPGYTNSNWNTSWGMLGGELNPIGLPLDPINKWVSCGKCTELNDQDQAQYCVSDDQCDGDNNTCKLLDPQTCWDEVDTEFICPAFSQIYEYEYDLMNQGYIFHAPLEFFNESDQITQAFIDPATFTKEPWCVQEIINPFDDVCGNGVVGATEQCDPPGKISYGNQTSIAEQIGQCEIITSQECISGPADCGYASFEPVGNTYYQSFSKTVCGLFGDFGALNTYALDLDNSETDSSIYGLVSCNFGPHCSDASKYPEGPIQFGLGDEAVIFNTKEELQAYLDENPQNCLVWTSGGQGAIAQECVGGVVAGFEQCAVGEIATQACNDQCQIEYGLCEAAVAECGNSIVEPGEACDDGSLNGTYGNCAGEGSFDQNGVPIPPCQGLHSEYCGNGKQDWNDINQDGGIDPGEALYEFCDWSAVININPDQPKFYSAQKALSCSWNCQDYGQYCGDGIVQDFSGGEECDDGNYENLDGCNQNCKLENIACKAKNPLFTTTTQQTNIILTAIDSNLNYSGNIKECIVGTTGDQICGAYGLTCDSLKEIKLLSHDPIAYSLEGPILTQIGADVCEMDLTGFGQALVQKELLVQCNGVYEGSLVEPELQVVPGCGNGLVEEGLGEACDLGDQNGISCDPAYGESCTYCSVDCGEILTKDSGEFCGDGVVSGPEICEQLPGGSVLDATSETVKNYCDGQDLICQQDCNPYDQKWPHGKDSLNSWVCTSFFDPGIRVNAVFANAPTGPDKLYGSVLGGEFSGQYVNFTTLKAFEDYDDPHNEICSKLFTGNQSSDLTYLVNECNSPDSPYYDFCENFKDKITNTKTCEGCEVDYDWCMSSKPAQTLTCPDMGEYTCSDSCNAIQSSCVSCGFFLDHPDSFVTIVDPMQDYSITSKMALKPVESFKFEFLENQFDAEGGLYAVETIAKFNTNAQGLEEVPMRYHLGVEDIGLETDMQCNGLYSVFFNSAELAGNQGINFSDTAWSAEKGDLFEYPVNNELNQVYHEYIYSRPVPPDVYRVIIKWNDQPLENDTKYIVANLYSDEFPNSGEASIKSFVEAAENPGEICNKIEKGLWPDNFIGGEYWNPRSTDTGTCGSGKGIYMHPVRLRQNYPQGEQRYDMSIQSVTFDTNQLATNKTVAFFVSSHAGKPIAQYADSDSNVEVLIYEYHEGQDSLLSVYQPVHQFKLKAAQESSTNPGAKYWHVFNFVNKSGKFVVENVQKKDNITGELLDSYWSNGSIETNFCEIINNLPNAEPC